MLHNPFAGRYDPDLTELVQASVELSATISAIAVAVTDGGRPLPRVGGLQVSEIVGEDGLR